MTKTTDIPPRETKSALVRKLLARKSGADIVALQEATGWQAHSVRAALSTLRKAGYTVDRLPAKKAGAAPVYRITGTPEAA
jgi:endonuclease/exonuclease/phosphatase family metal-dependent hydrolase